jgi:hypothetical protein
MDSEKILKRLDDVLDNKEVDVKEFSNVVADINKQLESIYGKELMDRAKNSPSNLGLDAFFEGKKESDNPYKQGTADFIEWIQSYNTGKRIQESNKAR